MEQEKPKKHNGWLIAQLKKKEQHKKLWEPYGLSEGKSKRDRSHKPQPHKNLRDLLDC